MEYDANINIRVKSFIPLPSPSDIRENISLTKEITNYITKCRSEIANILNGNDSRILIIIGPCSIHNTDTAIEYAKKLIELQKRLTNIYIVMRVYLQKPRTTVGWTGFLDDPELDGSYNTKEGILRSRQLLFDLAKLGIPTATEYLGTTLEPQYISDLISWGCIGARTVESQVHRHLVSGLSMPVGFKNSSDGSYQTALNACLCASTPRSFIGIDKDGNPGVIKTKGNKDLSIVLRGSYKMGPNIYLAPEVFDSMKSNNLKSSVIIDCAHGNSGKSLKGQVNAINLSKYYLRNNIVKGIMIESFLEPGNTKNVSQSRISITDPCLGWLSTKDILIHLNKL